MGKGWDKGNYCDIIPDVLFGVDLKDCCFEHDMDYWKKPVSRKYADFKLRLCIYKRFHEQGKARLGKYVSKIIYYVLRIGGWIKW